MPSGERSCENCVKNDPDMDPRCEHPKDCIERDWKDWKARPVVDADCNFLDGVRRCQYQPRFTYADCGNYGATDCPKKHPENFQTGNRGRSD